MDHHATSQVPSSRLGWVIEVGTKEDHEHSADGIGRYGEQTVLNWLYSPNLQVRDRIIFMSCISYKEGMWPFFISVTFFIHFCHISWSINLVRPYRLWKELSKLRSHALWFFWGWDIFHKFANPTNQLRGNNGKFAQLSS